MFTTVYRIAVCDDEREDLEQILQKTEEILEQKGIPFEIDVFSQGEELLRVLEEEERSYQLLMLDVVMEGLDGIALASAVRQMGEELSIIFISSSRDFAMQGYQVEAARYLEKPVEEQALREALLFCWKRCTAGRSFVVNTGKSIRKLPMDRLIYAETSGRGSILVMEEEKIWVRTTVSDLEKELVQPQFWRCHQSFLVNLNYVEHLRRYQLTLKGDFTIPVSKLRYDSTKSALFAFASD